MGQVKIQKRKIVKHPHKELDLRTPSGKILPY